MTRRRSLSDEEHALWTGIARSIKPLHRARNKPAEPVNAIEAGNSSEIVPSPAVTRRVATTPAAAEKAAPPLAPLGRKLKKRVARGREPIEARLDLHGFTQTQAHAALLRFLHGAQSDGVRIALVVTGKGASKRTDRDNGAPAQGILKRQVPMWLSLPEYRSFVIGFEDAHLGHGGQGALYVRLRRAR